MTDVPIPDQIRAAMAPAFANPTLATQPAGAAPKGPSRDRRPGVPVRGADTDREGFAAHRARAG